MSPCGTSASYVPSVVQSGSSDFTEGVPPWVPWEWLNYPALRGSYVIFEYWENADGVEMHEWLELTGYRGAIYDWNLLNPFVSDHRFL